MLVECRDLLDFELRLIIAVSHAQVLAPYDAEDARGLLKAAIRDPDPVVFLENEIMYGESFPVDDRILSKDFTLPIGKAKVCSSAPSKLYFRRDF